MRKLAGAALLALLVGCGSPPKKGGYYKDDGPQANPPANLASIPDAKPRAEPLHKFANRPYEQFGKNYVPLTSVRPFRQRGIASWYGKRFHGQKTASGEIYDMYAMTAAHPTLPIPSYARVTNLRNGRQVVVRVNDRGPFHSSRVIDLSYAAAYRLGYIEAGSAEVEVEAVVPSVSAGAHETIERL
jgi:rare lipoprotein A